MNHRSRTEATVMDMQHASDTICEALFASGLQQSDPATPQSVVAAISGTLARLGVEGCVSQVAEAFGDRPETACQRMRWARHLVRDMDCDQPELALAVAA
jgi:hypothetical protein